MSAPDPFDDPFDEPVVEEPRKIVVLGFDPANDHVRAVPPMGLDAAVVDVLGRPPADPYAYAQGLRQAIRQRVTDLAERLASERPSGRLTDASVQREVVTLTAVFDTLTALAAAFTDGAALAKECLREVTLERRGVDVEKDGGSTSVRVGAPGGGNVRVVVTQPTKVVVEDEAVIDVVAGLAVKDGLTAAVQSGATATTPAVVGAVARLALDLYRGLVSPPSWKITALDALRRDLERASDPAAVKLAAAYGRKPHGAVQTRVEHVAEEEGS